jgi:hypothetical protein
LLLYDCGRDYSNVSALQERPLQTLRHQPQRLSALPLQQCHKTFTPKPKSRAMTREKEAQIVAALQERISQRGIAHTFKVARLTIRNLRKKVLPTYRHGSPPAKFGINILDASKTSRSVLAGDS